MRRRFQENPRPLWRSALSALTSASDNSTPPCVPTFSISRRVWFDEFEIAAFAAHWMLLSLCTPFRPFIGRTQTAPAIRTEKGLGFDEFMIASSTTAMTRSKNAAVADRLEQEIR